MTICLAIFFGLLLAYANGANDNFKGVATLYGSGTSSYKGALIWSTAMTVLGSLLALMTAQGLLAAFSGKGLVPENVIAMKSFTLAVGLAAASTVMIATKFGLPISTTHALTGALVGSGLLASNSGVNFSQLGKTFFLPLVISPFLAVILAAAAFYFLQMLKNYFGVEKSTCVCVGAEPAGLVATAGHGARMNFQTPALAIGSEAQCENRFQGQLIGVSTGVLMEGLHYLSGGVVCFARALNDTPKIAATLLIGGAFSPSLAIAAATAAMAAGGLLNSRKIAETLSHKVTKMNYTQGLSANLITGLLVISASKYGLPVSTTHVSVGTLFGIGTVTRQAKRKIILNILLAWITTLPFAALLAAGIFLVLRKFI